MLRSSRRFGQPVLLTLAVLSALSCGDRAFAPGARLEPAAANDIQHFVIPTQCPAGATRWAAAVNGNWTDPARWTAGVPTAAVPACIDLPGTYIVTLSGAFNNTVIPAQQLFLGVPGASSQPTLRVLRGIVQFGTEAIIHGHLEVTPPLSNSASVTATNRLAIASTGRVSGPGPAGKTVEAATIENDGMIDAGLGSVAQGLNVRAASLVNRGSLAVAVSGRFLRLSGPTADGPALSLEDGTLDVVGALGFDQSGGKLFVRGGTIVGSPRFSGMEEVVLEHDAGGRVNILPLAGLQPHVTTKLSGTVGPSTHLWIGTNHMTVRTSGLVNKGQLTLEASGALGRQGLILETEADATILNEGTMTLLAASPNNLSPAVFGAITNAESGVIVNAGGTVAVMAATPLINRGILRAAVQQIRIVPKPDGTPPEVRLEGGSVESSVGRYQQTGGTMALTGGTVSGQLDLIALSELRLDHDGGGRFNMFRLGGLVPPTTSVLKGTVGENQHVWMGNNHLTVNAVAVVNSGRITVQHTSALGVQGTVLQPSGEAPLTNAATGLIEFNGTLAGHIVNEGLITNFASVNMFPNPLVNRGILRSAATFQLNANQVSGGPVPIIVNDGGRLDLLGSFTQSGGRFEHLDGTVTGAGASTFNAVRFSGYGTWGRTLSLAGASRLVPGASPGRLAITGDYAIGATGVTEVELAGDEPGTGYDQIAVANTARFAGSLGVALSNGFVPKPCQTFDVVTYAARTNTFSNAATPIDVGGGMKLRQVYTATKLVLVAYSANGPNVSPTQVEVSVDGTTAKYDVCIGAGADVITVIPDDQVTVDKTTLTFGTSQLPQTVTVAAAPGATRNEALIRHTASSGTAVGSVKVLISGIVAKDVDPPTTTATPTPAANEHGWNRGDVTVALSASDVGEGASGVREIVWSLAGAQTDGATSIGSSASVVVSAEGETQLSYFARDNAGNQESPKTVTIRIDKTAPTVTVTREPAPNAAGWNTTPVTATFTADDALSGIDGVATIRVEFTEDGANQSASRTFRDRAGNESTATITGISIDRIPPTLSCSATPNELWPPNGQLVDVTIRVTTAGASSFLLERVSSNEPGAGDIVDFETGTADVNGRLRAARLGSGTGRVYTFEYRALDEAGNSAVASCEVRVAHDQGKKKP